MPASYTLHVISHFTATRALRDYVGDCAKSHTQTFKIVVDVLTPKPDKKGLVIDFYIIKAILEKIIGEFEQCDLNQKVPFNNLNPTNENLAKYIFEELSKNLKHPKATVISSTVWENDLAGVTYKI